MASIVLEEDEEACPSSQSSVSHTRMNNESIYRQRISSLSSDPQTCKDLFDITASVLTFQRSVPRLDFDYYRDSSGNSFNIVVKGFSEDICVKSFYDAIHERHKCVLGARVNPTSKNIIVVVQDTSSHIRGFLVQGGDPNESDGGVTSMQVCAEKHGIRIKQQALQSSVCDSDANFLRDLALFCYFLQVEKPRLEFDFQLNNSGSMYTLTATGFSMNLDFSFLYQELLSAVRFSGKIVRVFVNPLRSSVLIHVRPTMMRSATVHDANYAKKTISKLLSIERKAIRKKPIPRHRHKHKHRKRSRW